MNKENNSKLSFENDKLFFINNFESKINTELINILKDEDLKKIYNNVIIGTTKNEKNIINNNINKIISIDDRNNFKRVLLASDYIIFDLNNSDLDDVEYCINILKYFNFKEEKKLILISNILTWSNTNYDQIIKEENEDEEGNEEFEDVEEKEEENQEENENSVNEENKEEIKKINNLTEKDYYFRIPSEKYNKFKELEILCLSAGKQKPLLKTFIVCPGIQYGDQEDSLFELFQQAWLNNPKELQYIGKGNNFIPLIHFKDVVLHIKKIIFNEIKLNYILAVDHSKIRTQKRIIKSISKGLGTNEIKSVDFEKCIYSDNLKEIWNLNLKFKYSSLFSLEEEEEKEEEDEEEDEEEEDENGEKIKKVKKYKMQYKWYSKEGLPKNILRIKDEFISCQNLRPNKIFITGPPCSGKTYFANELSNYFNIPHIKINEIINFYKNNSKNKELAEKIISNLEENKELLIEEARNEWEKKKLKKIKNLPKDIKEDEIIPRLSDEILFEILKERLNENDCISKGYIIDGIIKDYKFAESVFLKPKLNEDGEEIEDEKELNLNIIPNSIIYLKTDEEYIKNIINNTSEESYNEHLNLKSYNKRMKNWKNNNDKNTGIDILIDFFEENNFNIFELNLKNEYLNKFNAIKSFIERNGKFKNYIDNESLLEKQRKDREIQIIKEKEEKENKEKLDQEKREQIIRKLQKEEIRLKKKKEKENDNKFINEKSEFLKNYMMKNVSPILTEGIKELAKKLPEDPIDFLAEFLFENAIKLDNENKGDI